MAGYDTGAEALISSALTESLLRLVSWTKCPIDSIIYLTRAVRIIDLITNVNTQAFQSLDGMNVFVSRLVHEVDVCRKEEPHQIQLPHRQSSVNDVPTESQNTTASNVANVEQFVPGSQSQSTQCCSQRIVLIKSLLNFIKKAISDQQFSENIRHIMDGSLPNSLRHIISNPDYYGSMLFLRAIVIVTVFINQEPSQLASLQDKGLTDIIMHALLIKEIPPSREVLAHLPQTFSALCLNERGLNAFMSCNPFEKLFKVLLSIKYLNAMRKKRSSDSLGDTAISLGAAIDEIMRHQPTLKPRAMEAVIKLLDELIELGSNVKYSCTSKMSSSVNVAGVVLRPLVGVGGNNSSSAASTGNAVADGPSSRSTPVINAPNTGNSLANGETSEEDDDEDDDSRQPLALRDDDSNSRSSPATVQELRNKTSIPLVEYVQNVMKFVESILSNNSTDDHARLFIQVKGLPRLLNILTLENLPADFGAHSACQNVATVVRYLLSLTRDSTVLTTTLQQFCDSCLKKLAPIASASNIGTNFSHLLEDIHKFPINSADDIPCSSLFKTLGHTLSHLVVLNHMNRLVTNQNDLKALILNAWNDKTNDILSHLHELYRVLLWESNILHSFDFSKTESSENVLENLEFVDASGTNLVKSLLSKDTNPRSLTDINQPMEIDESGQSKKIDRVQSTASVKPYIDMSLRVCRHLTELFNLLVRVAVGGTARSRRGQSPYVMPPTPSGIALVERVLTNTKAVLYWRPQLDKAKVKLW
uniref:DUF913 domain-containing protein n=1 Tax=Romanomermis culicivorax TaxID=13658 RepID=A0A915HQK0_ROMCU